MRMQLAITLHVAGSAVDVTVDDDVDAEGTMVAKHVAPLVDAVKKHNVRVLDGARASLTLEDHAAVIFDKVSAVTWEVYGPMRYEGHDD